MIFTKTTIFELHQRLIDTSESKPGFKDATSLAVADSNIVCSEFSTCANQNINDLKYQGGE